MLASMLGGASKASQVLVEFRVFTKWIIALESRRGGRDLRTYRSLDRRVKTLLRRLRARGVELCFVTTSNPESACAGPEEVSDVKFKLAEEQVRAALDQRCQWTAIDESPSQRLQRMSEEDPRSAVVYGAGAMRWTPLVQEWLLNLPGDGSSEEAALARLESLADVEVKPQAKQERRPDRCQVEPPSLGLETFRTEVGGDAAELPASQMAMVHWVRSMADPAAAHAPLAEQASYLLRSEPLLQKLRGLPSKAKAWLLERAARGACASDSWLTDWVGLADKLVSGPSSWADCFSSWEPLGAATAIQLAARSVPMRAEELESLAWMVELLKPRRQAKAFVDSCVCLLDVEAKDDDEEPVNMMHAFQDALRGQIHLGQILELDEPWALEPKNCFDHALFRKLLARCRRSGLKSLGRRGPGRERGGGGVSFAATRASRLARLLANVTPLVDDAEGERDEKLSDLKAREEEIMRESFPDDDVKEPLPRFSAAVWRAREKLDASMRGGSSTASSDATKLSSDSPPQDGPERSASIDSSDELVFTSDFHELENEPEEDTLESQDLADPELTIRADWPDAGDGQEPRGRTKLADPWQTSELPQWETQRSEPPAQTTPSDAEGDAWQAPEERKAMSRAAASTIAQQSADGSASRAQSLPGDAEEDPWQALEEREAITWAAASTMPQQSAGRPASPAQAPPADEDEDPWQALEEREAMAWAAASTVPQQSAGRPASPAQAPPADEDEDPWQALEEREAMAWAAASTVPQPSAGRPASPAQAPPADEDEDPWQALEEREAMAWAAASTVPQQSAGRPASPAQAPPADEDEDPWQALEEREAMAWAAASTVPQPSAGRPASPAQALLGDAEEDPWQALAEREAMAWAAASAAQQQSAGRSASPAQALLGDAKEDPGQALEEREAMARAAASTVQQQSAGRFASPAQALLGDAKEDPWQALEEREAIPSSAWDVSSWTQQDDVRTSEFAEVDAVASQELQDDAWEAMKQQEQASYAAAVSSFLERDEDPWQVQEEREQKARAHLRSQASPKELPAERKQPLEELPIESMRREILQTVRAERVTILVGATGCGKSTQLPQFLMNEPRAQVLVTQPRRVAAVEIARRVASEQGERIGQNVGYRISGETVLGSGKLQFATIGYVLTWFLAKPEHFGGFTHVVIDEVHERAADMEMFLLLTKLLMYFFRKPKVVLMSATLQPGEFSNYFSEFASGRSISVPGRTFPVQEIFLDDLMSQYQDVLPGTVHSLVKAAASHFEQAWEDGELDAPYVLDGLPELAVQLVPYFAKRDSTLLVFMPGLVELNNLSGLFTPEALQAFPKRQSDAPSSYQVFVLHSVVPRSEQELVFRPPSGGKCHIVLASNIAESSLTLPKVTAVIDFALRREPVYDPKQGLTCLTTSWCSQASARQRSGRAGRTQPGIALRFVTRRFFQEKMPEFDTPEILRTSTSKLFLRAKKLSQVLQKTSERFSTECPLDLSSARSLIGSLPQPPKMLLLKAAVKELAQMGAIAAPDESADISSLGLFIDGLPLEPSLCRLVWFGALWGCINEAVIMAAACSSADPFSSPTRMYMESDDAYRAALRRSWIARQRFDGGHSSEPLMLLRLFCQWAARYWPLSRSSPGTSKRKSWEQAACALANEVDVHPGRLQKFVANVEDLAERARAGLQLPGGARTAASARRQLDGLVSFLHGEGPNPTGLLCADAPRLRAVLAAAFCEQLLIGRRFMDLLRAPTKRRDRSRGASVMGGPRASGEEEEALQDGHPADGGNSSMYLYDDDDFDLEEEFEDFEDDEEELDEDDEDEAEEEEEDDDEGDELDEEGAEGDGLVLDEEDAVSRLPWRKARNEMLMAVNSLPVTGRKYHHRILVAKIKKSKKDSPGSVHMEQLPQLMTQLCGRPPQCVSKEGKQSEFAAVCFPAEMVKELRLPLGPALAKPPVLAGASTSVSLGFAFSLGAGLIDLDGEVMARPSSPYQISFFLPERNTRNDEEQQKQVKALLEARNPIGFPCHMNAGDDFFCTASSLQLLSSRTTVRAMGATIFHAVEVLYAIAALCPDRTLMSVRLGPGPTGEAPGAPSHITAVKVWGWELSLMGDDRGDGAGVPADAALKAMSAVRRSVKEAMQVTSEQDMPERSGYKSRKLQKERFEAEMPSKVLEGLISIVSEASENLATTIDPKMRMSEAHARGIKRKGKAKKATWAEVLLAGEETGFADFLRPLELSTDPEVVTKRERQRVRSGQKPPRFQCPVCQEVFVRAKACRKHLKQSGHLSPAPGQTWRSLIEEECLLKPSASMVDAAQAG